MVVEYNVYEKKLKKITLYKYFFKDKNINKSLNMSSRLVPPNDTKPVRTKFTEFNCLLQDYIF